MSDGMARLDTIDVGSAPVESRAADYVELLKPRVMSLVVFTGVVGVALAPGHIHPLLAAVTILCIAVGAGASGAINMWFDRDIDAVMARTRGRPIPSGRVAPEEALGFGAVLAAGSVAVLGLAVNWLAAGLLAFTIGFYVFVYTMWLKRLTPQNIVIGGAAGALPPVIGWAAVTDAVGVLPLLMFALVFMWTPPHFWALSLVRCEDYARAGVPMLPVVAGRRETRRQILIYSVLLAPLAVAPWALGLTGWVYGVVSVAMSALLLAAALTIPVDGEAPAATGPARRLFGFSILYLFALFAALLVDAALIAGTARW
jgi:protoheme IX farnesyltransferase